MSRSPGSCRSEALRESRPGMSSGVMCRRCYAPLVALDFAWLDCFCLQVVLVLLADSCSQTEFHNNRGAFLVRIAF